MRLVLVFDIPDIDSTIVDPLEVVDALDYRPTEYAGAESLANQGKLGDPFHGSRFRLVAAEWEDNARTLSVAALLADDEED